jgi:hypothetical protein
MSMLCSSSDRAPTTTPAQPFLSDGSWGQRPTPRRVGPRTPTRRFPPTFELEGRRSGFLPQSASSTSTTASGHPVAYRPAGQPSAYRPAAGPISRARSSHPCPCCPRCHFSYRDSPLLLHYGRATRVPTKTKQRARPCTSAGRSPLVCCRTAAPSCDSPVSC